MPEAIGDRTHAVDFVTHSDMRELICGLVAGAILAKLADGLVFDEESGKFIDGDEALELARRAEAEYLWGVSPTISVERRVCTSLRRRARPEVSLAHRRPSVQRHWRFRRTRRGKAPFGQARGRGLETLAQQSALLLSRGPARSLVDAIAMHDVRLLNTLLNKTLRTADEVDWHTDWRGRRLAMLAVATGDLATVRLLLDHGAVHLGHLDHHTLLAEAARHGHLQVAQLLIDRGADLHTTGSDGLTPREWAAREGREDVVNSLRKLEAEAEFDRLGMS